MMVSNAFSEEPIKERNSDHQLFVWGYGARTLFLVLPYPYIEGGIQSSRYSFKAVLGSTLMWGRGTLEVARKQTFSQKTDLFLDFGYEYVFWGRAARIYGVGIDYLQDDERKLYFRFELDFYKTIFTETEGKYQGGGIDLVLPSVGIGYRF